MNQKEINELADANLGKAREMMEKSGITKIWEEAGCRVEIVGSVKMKLLANNRDIDLHVYSSGITEESTFSIAARMSAKPGVIEITSINGLHTDEHCMAWHVKFQSENGEIWKFDIIHIESGSEYDGYFERMAERIMEVMTPEQRETILRLKFFTPEDETIRGVEYYEAVISDGIGTIDELRIWVREHRKKPPYYWIP